MKTELTTELQPVSLKPAGVVFLALLGATVATFCDAIHVRTETLRYPNPFLFGQSPTVFPGFVGAFVTMALSYGLLVGRLPQSIARRFSTSPGNPRALAESLIAFALVYVLSGYGNRDPLMLAVIFYATAAVRIFFSEDRAFMAVLALILAAGGILAEGSMSLAGIVTYREPEIFGVPVWLGALYMHGAFALREGMRFFVYNAPVRA